MWRSAGYSGLYHVHIFRHAYWEGLLALRISSHAFWDNGDAHCLYSYKVGFLPKISTLRKVIVQELIQSKPSVGAMCAVPANIGGVAGATLQVAYQVGAAVSFAVQAGLFTVNEGGISNFDNLRASFYFELGFVALWLIGFLVFYRPSKNTEMAGDTERIVVGH